MNRTVFMKNLSVLVVLLFTFIQSTVAQGNWGDKIAWSFKIEKIDEKTADLVATAKLKQGWHVFSVTHDPAKADFTGIPTAFMIPASPNYKLIGKLKDGATPKKHNDELGLSIYFEKIGVFKQRLEILTDKAFDLNFDYSFQICDEEGCIFPPDQPGTVKVAGFNPAASSAVVAPEVKDPEEGLGENITVDPKPGETVIEQKVDQPEEKEEKKKIDQGLIAIFFTGFLFGFVALLTPCVFPMIPMTVSYFTKTSKTALNFSDDRPGS